MERLRRRLQEGKFNQKKGKIWLKNELGMNAFKLGRRQTCQVCATWVDVEEHGVRAISHNCHEESRVIDDILRLVGVLDTYCSSCRAIHSLNIRTQDTLRLFVTSSALAGFEDLDIGEGFHKETIAVSGARLMFLANRFRQGTIFLSEEI